MGSNFEMIEIYTDGSCKKNPGRGGWAYTIYDKETDNWGRGQGSEEGTTNNRMEMRAVIFALDHVKKHLTNEGKESTITIYTDSQYVIGGAVKGWKQKKNLDLWTELKAEMVGLDVEFVWVRGHNGDPRNEEVDRMAQEASGVR